MYSPPVEPWEFSSNSGRASLRGRLRDVIREDGQVIVVASLLFQARDLDGHPRERLTLPAVEIPAENLKRLAAACGAWLLEPIEIDVSLCEGEYSLRVTIRPEPDYISSPDKPVACFTYRRWANHGQFSYVVDQSCIRIFHMGLDGWLRYVR